MSTPQEQCALALFVGPLPPLHEGGKYERIVASWFQLGPTDKNGVRYFVGSAHSRQHGCVSFYQVATSSGRVLHTGPVYEKSQVVTIGGQRYRIEDNGEHGPRGGLRLSSVDVSRHDHIHISVKFVPGIGCLSPSIATPCVVRKPKLNRDGKRRLLLPESHDTNRTDS